MNTLRYSILYGLLANYGSVLCGQLPSIITMGGPVASFIASSTPERAVRVRAQAVDIALYSWARHFTLKVPLST